ncbi:MAG: anti-sigma factor [Tetrasphaera sp.]|nr:anti-sigma factor [Tetrasphaera sp.]
MSDQHTACEHHDLAAAYALDAVSDSERLSFEAHLIHCPTCQREVAAMREIASDLDLAQPEFDESEFAPLPRIRESLLAVVRSTPQEGEGAGAITQTTATPGTYDDLATRRERRERRAQRAARSPWSRRPLLVAAAVAALLTGGGLAVWQPWAPSPAERVVAAADARTYQGTAGAVTAKIVRSTSSDAIAVTEAKLPVLPSGRAYQAWFIDASGRPVSAGMVPDPTFADPLLLPGSATGVTAVAFSIEPAGGSAQPTTTPVLAIPLT